MIVRLTLLTCLLAIAYSRSVDLGIQIPLLVSRIVGGHDAEEGEFPHQVSLQIGIPGQVEFMHFCGGSIIKNNWIVTAAHCLVAVDKEKRGNPKVVFIVKAGKLDQSTLEDTEQLALVEKYFTHGNYIGENTVGPFDIGLIKLATPFALNKIVVPIALPKKDSEPTGNVILSGWGAFNSDPKNPQYPAILQTVNIPIISRRDCNEAIKMIAAETNESVGDLVHETNICTGPLSGGISACGGDSGGPLVAKKEDSSYELVGVVSWGVTPCGRKGAPAVFVRVSSFIDWLENIMSKN